MNTIIERERIEGTLRTYWSVKAHALTASAATKSDCRWIDRSIVDAPRLQVWLEFLEHLVTIDHDGEASEVRSAQAIDAAATTTWEHLLEHGFERTLAETTSATRKSVQRDMAAVVWNPVLLQELADRVVLAQPMTDVWKEISERTRTEKAGPEGRERSDGSRGRGA